MIRSICPMPEGSKAAKGSSNSATAGAFKRRRAIASRLRIPAENCRMGLGEWGAKPTSDKSDAARCFESLMPKSRDINERFWRALKSS